MVWVFSVPPPVSPSAPRSPPPFCPVLRSRSSVHPSIPLRARATIHGRRWWTGRCVLVVQHKTIDNVLERGTKLETLVEKSSDLGVASKAFYKTAKSANSRCCVIS